MLLITSKERGKKMIRITKKHIGRPVEMINLNGVKMHGRISDVRRGVATVKDCYVEGNCNQANGSYVAYIDKSNNWFTGITIY